ncbi:N-acetylglucosamine kinase [Curtobacterium sp. SGAir0471]|uniref:N-acetylglucosamine kinase n=1 Tax=Curtobacterium sp. SGAir0471 TaxID=2070337 RepID=UPI0010CD6938|nr:BadF/BadG/BcrA/BcrD ATPase family protein [Curtobacterium sp. SGAir0471]QCR42294.1 N-acetylglucosamine kinase [Curtobacterium sp. SGAir0471]
MTVFLGMDGGGTKTAFLLTDGEGTTLAESRQPTCYWFDAGTGLVGDNVRAGVDAVTAAAGITPADITSAYFGIPGHGESSRDTPVLDALPAAVLGHDRYSCGNDMIGGWAGSLAGRDGVNVIAGTGSMAYGERGGSAHRVGGWSEVFGDEGSAYWVAVQGLNAFSRMADGRLPRGPLHALLRERVGVTEDLDTIGVVMEEWGADRGTIADLAKVVVAAADAGDEAAADALHRAAAELTNLVVTTVRALGFPADEAVPVSYSGGLFRAPRFRQEFATALHVEDPHLELVEPRHDPTVGSVLVAMRRAGAPIPERFAADATPAISSAVAR